MQNKIVEKQFMLWSYHLVDWSFLTYYIISIWLSLAYYNLMVFGKKTQKLS